MLLSKEERRSKGRQAKGNGQERPSGEVTSMYTFAALSQTAHEAEEQTRMLLMRHAATNQPIKTAKSLTILCLE